MLLCVESRSPLQCLSHPRHDPVSERVRVSAGEHSAPASAPSDYELLVEGGGGTAGAVAAGAAPSGAGDLYGAFSGDAGQASGYGAWSES